MWAVDGVDATELVTSPKGFTYLPAAIPPTQLTLIPRDVVPREQPKRLFAWGVSGPVSTSRSVASCPRSNHRSTSSASQ